MQSHNTLGIAYIIAERKNDEWNKQWKRKTSCIQKLSVAFGCDLDIKQAGRWW